MEMVKNLTITKCKCDISTYYSYGWWTN